MARGLGSRLEYLGFRVQGSRPEVKIGSGELTPM